MFYVYLLYNTVLFREIIITHGVTLCPISPPLPFLFILICICLYLLPPVLSQSQMSSTLIHQKRFGQMQESKLAAQCLEGEEKCYYRILGIYIESDTINTIFVVLYGCYVVSLQKKAVHFHFRGNYFIMKTQLTGEGNRTTEFQQGDIIIVVVAVVVLIQYDLLHKVGDLKGTLGNSPSIDTPISRIRH